MEKIKSLHALFFDDLREEKGERLSLMGQFANKVLLGRAADKLRRLVVVVLGKFEPGFAPSSVAVVLQSLSKDEEIIALPESYIEKLRANEKAKTDDPFGAGEVQIQIVLGQPTYKAGDQLDVWLDVDGSRYPAGRLKFLTKEAKTTRRRRRVKALDAPEVAH